METLTLFELLHTLQATSDRTSTLHDLLTLVMELELSGLPGDQEIQSLAFRVGDSSIRLDKEDVIFISKHGTLRLRELVTLMKFVAFLREQKAGQLPNFLL